VPKAPSSPWLVPQAIVLSVGAADGEAVHNFYVIGVPADGDPEAHLQLLASIAATFSDSDFRSLLSCATTALQVEHAFRCAESGLFT
jgi:mannitol/fructose-specific phosphotransferase system IIA component (Ntr-type)